MPEAGPGGGRRKIRPLEPGAQGLVKRRSHRGCFPRKPGNYRHRRPLPRPGTCLRSGRGVARNSLAHRGVHANPGDQFPTGRDFWQGPPATLQGKIWLPGMGKKIKGRGGELGDRVQDQGLIDFCRTPLTADQVLGSEWKSCSQPTWLVVTLQGGHLTSWTSLFLSLLSSPLPSLHPRLPHPSPQGHTVSLVPLLACPPLQSPMTLLCKKQI